MPAGCEFICRNEECEHANTGFTVLGSWPIGVIDLIINTKKVQALEGFRNNLLSLKSEGEEYACINYPNIDKIPIVGYRVNKWCNTCRMIHNINIILEDGDTFEEALEKFEGGDRCFQCDGYLLDFEELVEDGIDCPYCKEQLVQSRWFANETEDETEDDTLEENV